MFFGHNTVDGLWVFEGEEADVASPSHQVVLVTAADLRGEHSGSTVTPP